MKILKWLSLSLLVVTVLLGGCSNSSSDPDVQFARSAFNALQSGDLSAQGMIDWPNLRGMGMDAGSLYNSMPNDTEKAAFRQSFVSLWAAKSNGATSDNLSNWRVQDETSHVVAADAPSGKTLTMTVSHADGTPKICDIEMN